MTFMNRRIESEDLYIKTKQRCLDSILLTPIEREPFNGGGRISECSLDESHRIVRQLIEKRLEGSIGVLQILTNPIYARNETPKTTVCLFKQHQRRKLGNQK